jgi:hypothetical protein
VKNILRLVPLAWLLTLATAQAECEPNIERVELPQPAPPIARTEIRSAVMSPSAGTPVRHDTVITLDVEYRIAGFSNGEFKLAPLFKSGTYRSKTIDFDGKDSAVPLPYEAGKVRLCLPLAQIYGAEAESVLWPLELRLTILQSNGKGGGTSDMLGTPLKLNTVDMPAAALVRQASAPPPEYDDALEHVFSYFQSNEALYKVCLQRVPGLQPKLTPVYRAWALRHKAAIDFVYGIKFESLKEQSKSRADIAMSIMDHIAEANRNVYAAQPEDRLRGQCEHLLEQWIPADDMTDSIIGSYLGVLRQWHDKK